VKLSPDRAVIHADGEDLSIITVAVLDAEGRVVPVAGNLIHFELRGPGAIIGVGNGDPSSHEADIYPDIPARHTIALNEWRFQRVETNLTNRAELREDFDDNQWDKADVTTLQGPLAAKESAVFRTRFEPAADVLASASVFLDFGMIDDEGWVYVNGHFVGESHDWTSEPAFEIRPFLRQGTNTIAVAVKNNDGPGGVNKTVTLSFADKPSPPPWQRHVFNGLAQVIVQAGTEPGKIQLTVRAEGLAETTVDISAEPSSPRPTAP
jgi:beta-galactosidase